MSLSVLVKSASGLPNVERFSKSDPMCVITLEGRTTLCQNHACMLHISTLFCCLVVQRGLLLTYAFFAVHV